MGYTTVIWSCGNNNSHPTHSQHCSHCNRNVVILMKFPSLVALHFENSSKWQHFSFSAHGNIILEHFASHLWSCKQYVFIFVNYNSSPRYKPQSATSYVIQQQEGLQPAILWCWYKTDMITSMNIMADAGQKIKDAVDGFHIEMWSYQYRKSQSSYETTIKLSHLHNGIYCSW